MQEGADQTARRVSEDGASCLCSEASAVGAWEFRSLVTDHAKLVGLGEEVYEFSSLCSGKPLKRLTYYWNVNGAI